MTIYQLAAHINDAEDYTVVLQPWQARSEATAPALELEAQPAAA